MTERLRVMLLFGGRSAEHDVSRVTAVAVARALDPARYEVVPVAITTDGRWLLAGEARTQIDRAAKVGPQVLPLSFAVEGETTTGLGELVATGERAALEVDVVFPLLHGPYGEDGTVQGLLELAGVPYVGSGVVGSAVGMDKIMMKRAFSACGLANARGLELRAGHDLDRFADAVERELGYPCFVKPVNMGSSVGVSKARDRVQLLAACELALTYDEWILVEEAVTGREIEVAVLGDDPPAASVPGEIVPGDDFYSYADKYEADAAQLLVPAPLTDEQVDEARRLATAAFAACRCEAMARVDLFLTPGGDFLVNEVNTIPGFTPVSMYPRLWEATGLPYPELLDRLVQLAFERHARREQRAGRQC
jgi:D-alanine-D-alanine ligase